MISSGTSVALIGTGLLGEAIGRRLLEQGVTLHVWNRTPSRCQSLLDAGAHHLETLASAKQASDVIITVLRDGPTTARSIAALGDLTGQSIIPMGTMGIVEIRRLAEQTNKQGGQLLESPVLGSRPQALAGTLLLMAGGEPSLFERHQPLLRYLSERPRLVGPVGSGAACKLGLNQLIASLTHAFSLSLRLIQQAEVPVETFMDILRPSALYAPTFDKKLKRMLDADYDDPNFSTSLLRKDVLLFLEEALAADLHAEGLSSLATLLGKAEGSALDALDYCALHELTASDNSQ